MHDGAVAPDLRARVRDLARRLPKVELHVHLEGTMSAELLDALARKHGVAIDPVALEPFVSGGSFTSFLEAFVARMRVLRDPDDWCLLLDSFLSAQSGQNVPYTEAFVTFAGPPLGGYDAGEVLKAMAGVERDWHARGCALRLVVDAPRQFGAELVMDRFRVAAADDTGLIVGVGIGGDELLGPAETFADAFAVARDAGLHRTAHAGELGGRDSVRAAVDVLHAERIGHGVAAAGDPQLLHHLCARGVTIDVCPGSNRATGAWDPQRGAHPVRSFVEHGVRIDVGSDDPAIFGTNLSDEWAELMLRDGFTPHECFDLTLDSLDAAFLDDAGRARLRAYFDSELEDLRDEAAALEEALHHPAATP